MLRQRSPIAFAFGLVGGLFVRVQEAEIDGDRVKVKMMVQNATNETLHVDRDGNVWVTDALASKDGTKGHQVIKLSPDGKVLMRLGTAGVAGGGPTHFNEPSDVVTAPNGDIYVTDGHSGQNPKVPPDYVTRVVKFSRDGKFIKEWGKLGTGPGEFRNAHALALDSRGWLPGSVTGLDVLCLAAAGGWQSILYATAGANVTVVDLSPAMLAQDRAVAARHGLQLRLVEASMDDLTMFTEGQFEVVIQPVSTCYVPDINRVYREVARVTACQGVYISQHKQPLNLQADVKGTGKGYVVREPYYRSGPLPELELPGVHREADGPGLAPAHPVGIRADRDLRAVDRGLEFEVVAKFEVETARLHGLAHEVCAGRWIATGGGGYQLVSVVPRAWTHAFAEMSAQVLPVQTPLAWHTVVDTRTGTRAPASFHDERVRLPAHLLAQTRDEATRAVEGLRRLLHPYHGL